MNPCHPTVGEGRGHLGAIIWEGDISGLTLRLTNTFLISFQNLKQIVPCTVELIKPIILQICTAGVNALRALCCLINNEHKLKPFSQ